MENNNAKHFALQLGSLISLYVSIGALISLVFGIITVQFPDPLRGYWEISNASEGMRMGVALLVVFFPTYLLLTRITNVARRAGGVYLPLTKWLIYLSLLIGGVVLLGDLVSIIYNFLNGELTTRFLLKALTVLTIVGSAFTYYVYDAKEYWKTHERQSKQYGLGMSVLILLAIVVGYLNMEKPAEVRERTADDRQISDLSTIQSFVMNYHTINKALPESLDQVEMRGSVPQSPEGRDAYTYTRTAADSFEMCAEFAYPSRPNEYSYAPYYDMNGTYLKNPDDWNHEVGTWCFKRVVVVPTAQN